MAKIPKGSVSATALSKMVVCEQQAMLEARGIKPARLTREQKQSLSLGDKEHARHHKMALKHHDARCFIATSVYGANSLQTKTLRQFRDQWLIPYPVGRLAVSMYYRLSPRVALFMDRHPTARMLGRHILNPIVRFAESLLWTR